MNLGQRMGGLTKRRGSHSHLALAMWKLMQIRLRRISRRVTRQHLQGALLGVMMVAAVGGLIASTAIMNMGRDNRWLGRRLVEKRRLIAHQRVQLAEFVAATERLSTTLVEASADLQAVQAIANVEHDDLARAVALSADLEQLVPIDPVAHALEQFTNLNEQANALGDAAHLLSGLLDDEKVWGGGVPNGWPVGGEVTSHFGMRPSPTSGRWKMHLGTDIRAPRGTRVEAAAPGRVTFTGYWGGYGKTIVVDHGGDLKTLYAHLSRIHVREGETIDRTETIGTVGSSGRTTGPHLHYEVRFRGRAVDPMCYTGRAVRTWSTQTALTTPG